MQTSFTMPTWVKGANVYEVNIRQYTPEGTFNAFAKHLDRLQQMGVQILWFMPVTPISKVKRLGTLGSYYAASDYTAINPEYGTLDDFKQLVDQAHNKGFKVIIDWVANHTGWDHIWTTSHPEFYRKNDAGNFYDTNGWEDVIDLDYTNHALRTEMISAMKFWLVNCNIDGFRCDMAHLVPLDFWITARTELSKVNPDLFWLAESEEILYHLAFDASYAWELLHTMENMYKGTAGIETLDKVLHKYQLMFPDDGLHLAFTSNHDENSHSGSEYERMGNGAKAFAVLCATWSNCLPLVYSGQEIPNKKRLLFFDKDSIDWSGECWLQNFYRSLLETRRVHPALHDGNPGNTITRIKTSAEDKIFAFSRQFNEDMLVVILHLSPTETVRFTIDEVMPAGNFESIFTRVQYQFTSSEHFEMKAWDYLVYAKVN